MKTASFVLVALFVASCGKLGGGDDAGLDAGSDAQVSDGASGDGPIWDGGVCDPNRPTLNQNEACDATQDAICQQWAQTVAIGAYGYSKCVTDPNTMRFYCDGPDCAGGCCGPDHGCATGQVCASSTPNGPRQCIQACAGL